MSPTRVLLIDDTSDGPRFATLLTKTLKVRCRAIGPPASLTKLAMLKQPPDVFLIDFELAQKQEDGTIAPYSGLALAAAIRDKIPTLPIVLVSRGELRKRLDSRRDLPASFDGLFYKENIRKSPTAVAEALVRLDLGFKALAAYPKLRWPDIVSELGAGNEEEVQALRVSTGPEAPTLKSQTWRVPEAARWIRTVVLEYPGILLDTLHAATLLGIDEASFETPRLQRELSSAKYSGPFAMSPRWWKGRLLRHCARVLARAKTTGPTQAFVDAWNATHRPGRLKRAKCIVSETFTADSVCWILRGPVKREFSLPYQPDGRPQIMDVSRVSNKAIQEDNRFQEEAVPLSYHHLVEALQGRGRRARK